MSEKNTQEKEKQNAVIKIVGIVLCIGIIISIIFNVYAFNINNTIKTEINTIEADMEALESENITLDKDIETKKNTLSSLSTQIEELNTTIEGLEADNIINSTTESTIEISDEDYCYISMLEGMLTAPEYYWYIEDELNNTPENNRFAIIDIDQDGTKEFLNEYEGVKPWSSDIFNVIDIYYGKEKIVNSYNETEIYDNGVVIDREQSEYESLAIYKGTDEVNYVYEFNKSLPPETYEGEFLEDQDTDKDGIIYVWTDKDYNTFYLTIKEYKDKLNSLLEGAERIEIPWQSITKENIANIYPYTLPEDNNLLEDGSIIWTYIADQVNACDYEKENDIAGFIECYLNLHHFENCLQDILPSAEVVYEDGEILLGYNLSLDDTNNIAKYGFQKEVTIEDLVSQGMKDIGDNKVQLLLDTYGMLPSYHMQIIDTGQDQSTQIIKGICNCVGSEAESITGYKFNIAIEKNPASNLDGYEIKACEVERVVDEKRIVIF